MAEEISIITNGILNVAISDFGAQVQSIKQNNIEYLWQGDKKWWPRRAPILFPIVGRLRSNKAESENGEINLTQHGVARNYTHEIEAVTTSSITYLFTSNEETYKKYPYDFELRVSYEIDDESLLTQTFEVTNTSDVNLPFIIGAHPAFNCPLQDDEFSDYELRFSEKWSYSSPSVDLGTHLLDRVNTFNVIDNSDTLPITHELFDCDTITFKDVPQSHVELISKKTSHGVVMDFKDFKYLGVWSAKNNAPFVALEPWSGCSTFVDEDDIFEHKSNVSILTPGKTKTFSLSMKFI